MKLSTVEIFNFRGIQHLALDLDRITVLLGENNTCKTTVLDAIRICLRDLRSNRGTLFDPLDFHLPDGAADPTQAPPINIKLTFQEELENRWPDTLTRALAREKMSHILPETDLGRVRLSVTGKYDAASAEFTHEYAFLDAADNPIPNVGGRALYTLQEQVPFYYLSALRDATKHFDAKGMYWRPFLRSSALPEAERTELEGDLQTLNERIVATHTGFTAAREKLTLIQQVVPMAQDDLVSINAIPAKIFDMLSRTQVNLGSTTGAKIPVDRHGEGTQSLAVLMLFSAFLDQSRGGTPFVALEEPEAHLHPNAVRALWQLIDQLPGQVIVSTHSGELAAEAPVKCARRLSRRGNTVSAHRLGPTTLDPTEKQKFDFHVRYSRGDLLLAKCWLLVEGESEVALLPELARFLDIPLARNGVRCIPYRQADIDLYLKAANDLGIAWCVLTDNDDQGAQDTIKARARLNGRNEADVIYAMPENDLETYLCSEGWGYIYESHLTQQTRANVTVQPNQVGYWRAVTKALKKSISKPAVVLEVFEAIVQAGRHRAPTLFVSLLQGAVRTAEVG